MSARLLLTPQLADSLVDAVRRSVPIETAVRAAGISQTVFYGWLTTAERGTWQDGVPIDPESLKTIVSFVARIRSAQADCEAEHVAAIAAAGSVIGKSGVPEWRARAWLLNNHPRTRSTYRQHREVEVHQSGTVTHEHRLASNLDDSALEQAADKLSLPS